MLAQTGTDSLPLLTYLNSMLTWIVGHLSELTLVFPLFEPTYL